MKNNISTFIDYKNFIKKVNKKENKKEKEKEKEKENKIFNNFKITNNSPYHHNSTGKCFLVNLKFLSNYNITSLPKAKTTIKQKTTKKPDIFPVINFNQKNLHLNTINPLHSMSLTKNKKIKKLKKFNTNTENNKYKTINLEFNLNLSTNNNSNGGNKTNYSNNASLSQSSYFLDTKNRINEILEKINKRYFVQLTTINYLNDIFYGNRDNQDIKYIDLSKIKIKKKKDIYDDDNNNFKINNISRYRSNAKKININRRINTFSERKKENSNDIYNYNKINVNERIKKFRNLKMNKCKEMVNKALKDLIKTRENNLNYMESFKKSCDFKYEDFLNTNL